MEDLEGEPEHTMSWDCDYAESILYIVYAALMIGTEEPANKGKMRLEIELVEEEGRLNTRVAYSETVQGMTDEAMWSFIASVKQE
ncbi:hypothetical protein L1887_25256 [Cichorium endivia]|nr:hypothetical protein L1887_25256 [Cichorium endivia]